nr:MAG: Connector [Bacteriophage sp.]
MTKRKGREFWESAVMNNATFRQYYDRLVELSISMFEWTNLPDTIDPRFLELTLFADGNAVFFKDEEIGFLALQNIIAGPLDVYRIPIHRRAFSVNGYSKDLNNKDSVIIWNNALHKNSMLDVQMFAKRLYNLDRAVDVNANAQKTPILIVCEESQRLTFENLYKEYQGNAPVIKGDKGLNPDAFKVLKTDAPFVADKLYQLKVQIWNEALTFLGISNINVTKKERLITDEVTRNLGAIIANRYSRLNARREACKQINRMFGLDIWCDYREDYQEVVAVENETTDEAPATADGEEDEHE